MSLRSQGSRLAAGGPAARLAAVLFICALPALAQVNFGSDPTAGPPKVTLEGSIQRKTGNEIAGTVVAKILTGWHINSAKPLSEFAIPTALKLEGAELVSAQFPPHELRSFAFTNGEQLAVYQGTINIPFVARLSGGANLIKATLRYQACDDHVCLPPKSATVDLDVTKIAAPPAGFTPLKDAPKDGGPRLSSGDIGGIVASRGMPLALLVLFLGGLALNLTPCVFPLIPITMGFFAMQSEGRRSRRFLLSLSYVLGIVITYSVLGLAAALGGKMFGAWLQIPWVLIAFAILMIALAASMFGAWEMSAPRFIANRSGGRAGLAGALTMGLFVGIVAAPCVGPFVVALITFVASIGRPVIGFIMFATLGFGLGFPYLVALSALPKPGEWMVQVKKAMGFVLIAMAFYFLRPLTGDVIFRWGVALSLLVGAGFLFASRAQSGRVMRLACASLLLIAGAAFAIPRSRGAEVRWDPYDGKSLAAASASNKLVIIDFYADWCLPCKELDEKTFSDATVAAEMQRFIRVKANLTATDDPMTQKLTKDYAIVGVPTIVFLQPDGKEITALRLTGFEGPDKFLARLRQAH